VKKLSIAFLILVCMVILTTIMIMNVGINAASWETVVNTEFNSISELESGWQYYYPWGQDHNGTAHMTKNTKNLYIQDGCLYLKATKRSDGEYDSGAIYAKHIVKITEQNPDYSLEIRAKVPNVKGTWPAFWLTHAGDWIAEMDVMEFKGDSVNWQNTYDNGSWQTVKTTVSNPGNWHTYKVYFNKINDTEVNVHYYVDGNWKAQHKAKFVNKPFWVIANLQMEGSSGSPGPGEATYAIDYIKIDRTTQSPASNTTISSSQQTTNVPQSTAIKTTTNTNTNTTSTGLTGTYAIENQWGSGATVKFVVTNNGSTTRNNWKVTWTFGGDQKITNMWNGEYSQSSSNVTVTNTAWNGTLNANQSVTFGFNISYSGTNTVPTNILVQ